MDTWTPVRPLQVDVIGTHPRYSRLLLAKMLLDCPLPDRWAALFDETASQEPASTSGPPQLREQAVHIHADPDDAARLRLEAARKRADAITGNYKARRATQPGT
jgi:hypothetical protein